MPEQYSQSDQEKWEILRTLLLGEEKKLVERHQNILETEEALDQKIGPIIESHLELMKLKFPEQYKKQVDLMIKHQLANSKDEIIGAIYPELGMLIKKYIQHQIQQLRDSIASQISETKSSVFFWKKKKHALQAADTILAQTHKPQLEEIFLIKYPEGTIIAHAARNGMGTAPDAVAGMLTAIKAFVSDAFEKNEQHVHLIQYQTEVLLLEHYHSYYFATLLSGAITITEQNEISEKMYRFLQSEYVNLHRAESQISRKLLSEKLDDHFLQQKPTKY
jgi:hypothetical protein